MADEINITKKELDLLAEILNEHNLQEVTLRKGVHNSIDVELTLKANSDKSLSTIEAKSN